MEPREDGEAGAGSNTDCCAASPCNWLRRLSRDLHWSFVLAVVAVYGACQGVGNSVGGVAAGYYWKDVQLLQPSAAQFYQGLTDAPWVIKPLWGLLTDIVPVAGFRRRPYFVLAGQRSELPWFRRIGGASVLSLQLCRRDWCVVYAHAFSAPRPGGRTGIAGADGAERRRCCSRRDGGRPGCTEQHHASAPRCRHAKPVRIQLLSWGVAWILHQWSACSLNGISGLKL